MLVQLVREEERHLTCETAAKASESVGVEFEVSNTNREKAFKSFTELLQQALTRTSILVSL